MSPGKQKTFCTLMAPWNRACQVSFHVLYRLFQVCREMHTLLSLIIFIRGVYVRCVFPIKSTRQKTTVISSYFMIGLRQLHLVPSNVFFCVCESMVDIGHYVSFRDATWQFNIYINMCNRCTLHVSVIHVCTVEPWTARALGARTVRNPGKTSDSPHS